MHVFAHPTPPKQSLSLQALCNEIETIHYNKINECCHNVVEYLKNNEQVHDLLPSVSELVHIFFYKLNYEIKQCFLKEKQELYPFILGDSTKDKMEIDSVIEPYKDKHELILKISKKLGQVLCGYETHPHWSREFTNFINELFLLENNIYKWIHVEEDLLFPRLMSSIERDKYIATVFR